MDGTEVLTAGREPNAIERFYCYSLLADLIRFKITVFRQRSIKAYKEETQETQSYKKCITADNLKVLNKHVFGTEKNPILHKLTSYKKFV